MRHSVENFKQCRNINLLFHRLPPHYTGFALGPTNPEPIFVAQETLDLRWRGFSPLFLLLMPAFSLLYAPPDLTIQLQRIQNAPLPLL